MVAESREVYFEISYTGIFVCRSPPPNRNERLPTTIYTHSYEYNRLLLFYYYYCCMQGGASIYGVTVKILWLLWHRDIQV